MSATATDFGDPDRTIYIPARELTGTREAKLAELDTFLAQLELVRLVLCGQAVRLEGFVGAPGESRRIHRGSHVWAGPLRRVQALFEPRKASAQRARVTSHDDEGPRGGGQGAR